MRALTTALTLVPCLVASATDLPLVVDSASSPTTVSGEISSAFDGFLIGNYDPRTNPGGTLTRPGLFGGEGNQPVDVSLAPGATTDLGASMTGMMQADVDLETLTIAISDLALDLLGGTTGLAALEVALDFQTFRTFNPDSIFFGIPLTLPLGDAEVTTLTLEQNGDAALGVLTNQDGDTYDVTVIVPSTLNATLVVLGQELVVPIPFALPLVGTLTIGCDGSTLSVDFAQAIDDTNDGPFDGLGFDATPFPLPTLSGETANVLLTASLEQLTTQVDIGFTLVATGPGAGGSTDIDMNGVVDVSDLLAVVADFLACGFCPADVNCDGIVDIDDLLAVLADYEI